MKILIVFVLWAAPAPAFTYYEGCKLYELNLESNHHQDIITSLTTNKLFDFWSMPNKLGLPVTVMVYAEAQAEFLNTLTVEKIPYKVLIEDVEDAVKSERRHQNRFQNRRRGQITFENYNRYTEIESYVQRLANDYPDILNLEQFQTTYEGRAMWLLKIGVGSQSKPTILIDGGIHAREWISPAVVLYIIQQLVQNKENRHMIENVNWYIIPILNPDGYDYTFTHDRFWRLNRAPVTDSDCIGTDLNRNFDFHWGGPGSSPVPCNPTFRGRYAFDQLETGGLRDIVNKYKNQIKLYLTFHSAAQVIIYPWGYSNELPEDAPELQSLGEQVAAAISSVNGTLYSVSNTASLLPFGAGGSDDWVKGAGGVELSYTFELPKKRFDLPPSDIIGICVETFQGVEVYHNYIENKFKNL